MPDIARLDSDGTLVAVETVPPDQHRTDLQARTIALPEHHDMRQRLNGYRWDFRHHCFMPLSTEPLAAAERDDPDLVEGLVQAVEEIEEKLGVAMPHLTRQALRQYRRRAPRRRERDQ